MQEVVKNEGNKYLRNREGEGKKKWLEQKGIGFNQTLFNRYCTILARATF